MKSQALVMSQDYLSELQKDKNEELLKLNEKFFIL